MNVTLPKKKITIDHFTTVKKSITIDHFTAVKFDCEKRKKSLNSCKSRFWKLALLAKSHRNISTDGKCQPTEIY